jgi:DNA-binding beta-propeller fold protein YncE
LPGRPQAIASGYGSVWIGTAGDDRLWRIDGANGQITASIPLGLAPTAVAAGSGPVWVIGHTGILERIDPTTNTLEHTIRIGRRIAGLALGGGKLALAVD